MNTASPRGSGMKAKAYNLNELDMQQVRPGFSRTGIRSDEAVTTVNWFEPGYKTAGPHSHPFDQLSYVLTGSMRFYVDDEVFDLIAPAVLHIPGGAPHCAEPLGDERVLNLDIFAPLREDYLALCEHQGYGQ